MIYKFFFQFFWKYCLIENLYIIAKSFFILSHVIVFIGKKILKSYGLVCLFFYDLTNINNCLVWQCFPWIVFFSNNTTLNGASINLRISRFMLLPFVHLSFFRTVHLSSPTISESDFNIIAFVNQSEKVCFSYLVTVNALIFIFLRLLGRRWTELCFFFGDQQSLFALLLFLLRDFVLQIITFFLIGMWCIFQENWSEGHEKHRCSFLVLLIKSSFPFSKFY